MPESATFPVQHGRYLCGVPWAFVAPHDAQAKQNHEQTLLQLSLRRGLDSSELLCVLRDERYPLHFRAIAGAEEAIIALLAAWLAAQEESHG